jgi:hypothetical protein
MANLMYAEMGLNFVSGLGKFAIGRTQAKVDAAIRKYKETMSALSAANSKNAITLNEISSQDQTTFARLSIQTAEMQERAAFDVEAAAAGVIGRSVDIGRVALEGDAARARTSLERQADQQRMQYGQQRKEIDLQRIYSADITPIQKPSLGATMFGLASSMIDTWDAHNPEDRRTSAFLSRRK